MIDFITSKLKDLNIDRIGIIDINDCDVINPRLLPEWAKSVIIFCIPYRSTTEFANDGFSEYARVYDYHNFSRILYDEIRTNLSDSTYQFAGFCDHSPINEKLAAAKCDLGVIGRNSLFIDHVYGSFVFIGSIITNYLCNEHASEVTKCLNCGLCIDACPNFAILNNGIDRCKCLSGISQKKRKTEDEIRLLKDNNIIWGCDICQKVCPYNKTALISPMTYFKTTRIDNVTKEFISSLSDEEFNKYAFSYKGREIILKNMDFE